MTFSLLVFLAFSFLFPFIRFILLKTPDKIQNEKNIIIVGHRGAAGLAPENTMASFKKALELGVDIIELDIHLSADDKLIVMHDHNVRRTTNGTGEIADLTLAEIKKLDAGSSFHQKHSNEKVPTLNEVLDLVGNKCKVMIEIKWPKKGIYEGLVDELVNILEKGNLINNVIVQSFEVEYLKKIMQLNRDIECHQLIFGEAAILPIYYDRILKIGRFEPLPNVRSINSYYYYLNKNIIKKNKALNIESGAFTIDTMAKMEKAISLGTTYIITDYPNIANELVR